MASNTTNVHLTNSIDVSTVFGLFLFSVFISILLLLIIIYLIFSTKTLFTPTNVLVCNTCVTTFLYLITAIVEISIFYYGIIISDFWCKTQAYLNFVFLTSLMYSYVIQAISRLFFTMFYKYRYLLNYKCHFMLIICQVILSFLIPLPNIITQNIGFRPLKLCINPMKYLFQVFYFYTFLFFIPFIVVIIIYIVILRRAIQSSLNVQHSWLRIRRDVELVRNILIILTIYLLSELPAMIYFILSIQLVPTSKAFYMFAATLPSISTAFEKISVIILNKEIRKEILKRWRILCDTLQLHSNQIQPLTSLKTPIKK